MTSSKCRCSRDEDGHLLHDQHEDECPAGELELWAGRMLDYYRTQDDPRAEP